MAQLSFPMPDDRRPDYVTIAEAAAELHCHERTAAERSIAAPCALVVSAAPPTPEAPGASAAPTSTPGRTPAS
jgi:hypothetical protein